MQDVVVHDDPQSKKRSPDRVFGLRNTRNFEDYLSQPFLHRPTGTAGPEVRDLVRTTPFKEQSEPLLFPFLLLEAKSESSSAGFDSIQAQSALPLMKLLKLQEELKELVLNNEECHSLVWFLANRGDYWKVYAGHGKRGSDGEPRYVSGFSSISLSFNLFQLQARYALFGTILFMHDPWN